jgi:hypothetical protein
MHKRRMLMRYILLVHVDSVVVLTTSVTATSRMLSVLADATVTSAHVSSLLPVLLESGNLWNRETERVSRQARWLVQVRRERT